MMNEKLKEFEWVRKEISDLIKAFPEASREKIIFDKWSLKDIVAHLSNWMVHDIECIEALKQGNEPYWETSFDEFNERGVGERKGWDWEKIIEEYERLNINLIDEYKSLSDNLWDVPVWKGFGLTMIKFVQKDIEHNKQHLEELARIRDTVSRRI